jgi:mycothiol system anti-sigma-R factor
MSGQSDSQGLLGAQGSAAAPKVTDCTETVLRIFEFLDGEMGPDDCVRIQSHLDECGPCLREYQLDQALKIVVKRSCGSEQAPVELRTTILRRLTMVHLEISE